MKILIAAAMLALAAGAAMAQDKPAAAANTTAASSSESSSSSSAPAGTCTAPVAPPSWSPTLPPKPVAPSCLNLTTRMSTCSRAVLDRYNAAVETHNAQLRKSISETNAYIDTLNRFSRAANDYDLCEVDRLNRLIDHGNGG